MKTIQMEMTLNQANIIVNALDLYSRMYMGQFSSLYSFLRMNEVAGRDLIDRDFHEKMDAYDEAEVHLKKFAETLGFSYNGSWGILSKEIHNEAREAFDIQQVLRQVESWTRKGKELGKDERDWTEMMGVNFDDPMFCSGKEPVKVKVVENEE